MINNLVRKDGAPAVAYNAHDVSVQWRCLLRILHSDAQFGISLAFSLPSHGVDEKPLVFRYEGNNLVPGGISFKKHNIPLPADLGRNGESKPGTLCLTLKERCSVWYSKKCSGSLRADFPKLLPLARAQDVCIDFDTNWLGKHLKQLEGLFTVSREFAEIPLLQQFTDDYDQAHWPLLECIPDPSPKVHVPDEDLAFGVVSSIENAGAEASFLQDLEHDSPPPYAAQFSGKRSSHIGRSLTPDHDSKRARKRSPSSTASSTATVPVDLFQQHVTSAVKQALSHELKKELTQVVKNELPHALEELLQKTPAGDSPSPCLSPASPCSQILNALTHHEPTPTHHSTLSTMIKEAVTTIFRQTLDKADTGSSALYDSAALDLAEYSTELRGDLAARKEDHMASCNDSLNEMKAEFEHHLETKLDDFKACADEIVLGIEDRLNKLGDTISSQTLCRRGDLFVASEQSQRAKSLPVSKDDKERIAKWT